MAEVCAGFTSFARSPPCPPLPTLSSFCSLSPPRRTSATCTALSAATLGASLARLSTAREALAGILSSGVIACLRAESAELAMEAARAALNGGITVLEIVMTTPGALEVIEELQREYTSSIFGVGTVLSIEDARNAVSAGAMFLMSPVTIKEILFDIQGEDVLYIPGAMTPTEVFDAHNLGARIVKIYPTSVLGGAQYISVLKKPFCHIPMVASQGITIDLIKTYIDRGASAVVLSDAIFEKAAMSQRNYDAIYRLAALASFQGSQAVNR
ncbi:unnamed protein product [Spirodela intermedia]|uniref:Uncharacterized protein n=1 Tax=Spirodela intermedia TaxID=51605 RepID=A0A7I8KLB2_SPIIN|nr:unnamed protein product [Spirodela intermedia]